MHALAIRPDLEVPPSEEPEVPPSPRRHAGKRTLTARLQPRGEPVHDVATLRPRGHGAPLPANVLAAVHATLGLDATAVRVHVDGEAEALGVQAFAVGDAIHVAAGAYQPDTAAGRALLGHELVHVAQQRAGRVAAPLATTARGRDGEVPVVIDSALEAEADRLGDQLARDVAAADPRAFDLDAFLDGPGPTRAASPTRGSASPAIAATPPAAVAQGKDAGASGSSSASSKGTGAPGTATDTWTAGEIPADEATALARWKKGYDRFARVYDWGLSLKVEDGEGEPSRETLFRNTCEWIRDGHAKVCLVSPVPVAQQDSTGNTCFDDRLTYPNVAQRIGGASTGWDIASFYGFYEESKDTLSLVDLGADRWDDNTIIGTMIHEIQHDADSGPGDATYPDVDRTFSQYKSEFRAWWFDPIDGPKMGDPSRPAANDGTVIDPWASGSAARSTRATGFKNERQYNVFMNLVNTGGVYAYVAHGFVAVQSFHDMVLAYDEPVGGNLLNSVRVEELVQLICSSRPFPEIRTCAHDKLEAADRTFLLDRAQSADFWTAAAAHLPARQVTELEAAIRSGGTPTAPADGRYQYTVVAGDTLSLIAGRLLGDPMRYPDLCAIPENPQAIRDNPDLIEPGWVLWIPGK